MHFSAVSIFYPLKVPASSNSELEMSYNKEINVHAICKPLWCTSCTLNTQWASQAAPVVKNLPAKAGDVGDSVSIFMSGRSPGGGHNNRLQYFCMENPMDRGAWWSAVPGVTESRTWLKQLTTAQHTHIHGGDREPIRSMCIYDLGPYLYNSIFKLCAK